MWPPFLYPPSAVEAAMSSVSLASVAFLATSEFRGDNLAYSKFGLGRGGAAWRVPSRAGMLVIYGPALAAALASSLVPGGARERVLAAALAAHFLKRVLEVLLVHRYSGTTPLPTALTIASHYLFTAAAMVYAQRLSHGLPEPPVDLLRPGVLAFAVGVAGNLYHHCLLSRLRADGGESGANKGGYRIPRGGLFELVACPHYLFEIVAFFGFAMIAQTVFALAVAVGTAAYLAGRSFATRRWYVSKFDDFPPRIKALVPYVY